ncbi:MAG: hypothetical protein EWV76_06650 [Microcystis novacekii Mn_MB_F_20050700_S1]|uniref:Tail fiber protein n=1 Tax=Microcystis novacekii Mn_MB_F_20050700_S1D TaxID=2486266 RepID=A0A552IVT5_9CHRO|nr:MAG: hypothetical protein EWV54_12240 [Microcystis novacekii Mn_MB_F_20050700_S1D]TRU89910.1 MAG: hypothetical protein EWV76_06650 [Microcystis novacekii Mn_MB_F_20050700_S1]
MPLADTLNRKPGDVLKSDDWNVIIKEIDRKINRDGADTLKGPLTIAEALNANSNVTVKGSLNIVVPQPQDPDGQILGLGPTDASNLRLGYHQDYSWIQSHGGKPLLINRLGNNIGIGWCSTINPVAKLDIASADRTGTHPTAVKGLYITGDFNSDNDGVEFRHSSGTQGIGFGFNTIYAAGSNPNQDLGLKPKGTGEVKVAGNLSVTGSVTGSVSFGSKVRQMLNLWSTNYGIGVQHLTQYFRSDANFAWYKGGSHNDGELNAGGGAVQMVIKDGNVGIGTPNPSTKLEINGDLRVTGTITGTIDATNITTGTLNVARIPNLSANKIIDVVYDIYLRGSAYESTEGTITFLKIANLDFGLTTKRGLNTIILNPGGAYKRKANHDVHGDNNNWNNWADWVNSNAADGDVVAVASFDALTIAPKTGSAATLLGAINGTKAFSANYRVSYALFFIKGESKCIEVLGAYQGPNAHLKTSYAFSQLLFNFNFNNEEDWIVPAFMNGWVNYYDGYNPAGYFKDSLGIVHLRGLVKNGTNNTTIFTLPVGYRPSNRELQTIQTYDQKSSMYVTGRVDILAEGPVTVVSGRDGWVSLDGITFRAGR